MNDRLTDGNAIRSLRRMEAERPGLDADTTDADLAMWARATIIPELESLGLVGGTADGPGEGAFEYESTHASKADGSPAMQVGMFGDLIVLVNEDGVAWSDPADEWEALV